jgi:hypothetical protein
MGSTTVYGSRAITVDTGGVLNVVLASSAGDDFTVDTNKLVVSGDSGDVGIGTAAPAGILNVAKSGVALVYYDSFSTTNGHEIRLSFRKSASATIGTFAETADGEGLGEIYFSGVNSSSGDNMGAKISVRQDGSSGSSTVPAYMAFSTSTNAALSEAMRIDSAGHLLVGHTSSVPTFGSTNFALQLSGTADDDSSMQVGRFSNNNAPSQFSFLKSRGGLGAYTIVQDDDRIGCINYMPADGSDFDTHAACFKVEVDDASPAAGDIGTAFVFEQMPGGTGALRETMRISAAGNVGIGTGSPAGVLDVTIAGQAKTATGGVYAYLGKSNESSGYSALQLFAMGGASAPDRKWKFQTVEAGVANTGSIVFQESGGFVGIGTASPTHKLHVVGDIKLQSSQIHCSDGYGLLWGDNGLNGNAATDSLRFDTAGGQRIGINSAGLVTVGNELTVVGITTLSGLRVETKDKTAAYTLLATDSNITADAVGGAFSVTLIASPVDGQTYTIRRVNSGANDVTIAGNSVNINGAASIALTSQYESVVLIYNANDGEWGIY